ncbi:ABC transporter nucleotide binding-ATPase protein [Salinisphaera shabanensis E1L3A]|uniref:ABC transporter nucleotide binding-ATPase protein n=1 Tax=Salinisphaera shabanensis E1L3A TaxID=1033802 RepID=U2EP50_9GAMM|nr:ABC transporter ATP-binding protein [Salinisphaera shabanensis]ERJ19585.1 ABC transporter nucleotide binding-ATPase protein [Salinisphaera shabanensis E1L3A]
MNTAQNTPMGRFDDAAIVLEDTAVTYGRGETATRALDTTSLVLRDGEFVALVGPSGCGKSTILKLAAGLLPASEGYVFVGGREISARAARVGIAFQNATMLPWLSVRDNIMLPLKIVSPFKAGYRSKKATEYRERADALLAQVGLDGFGDKYPWQLSGGMLQRASLCRALIHEPRVLLLDEPFGALDQFTREELWGILQDLWLDKKPTVLLVTHDLREAAYLASRVCIMSPRPGRIVEDRAVDFQRPRTVARTYDNDFIKLMQDLRALITHDGPNTVGSAAS